MEINRFPKLKRRKKTYCTYPNSTRVLGFAAKVVEVDDLGPVLEGGDSKEGDHGNAHAAPVKRIVTAEAHDANN
jgi:hypothetical protein